ncbi:hypothetical protein HELRODRAFT_177812 [Helobdella robusta]|uniref:Apple domain-containing protein n=1 Tax=Helobdella robusta TaxID=6412 RepID=T1FCB0_HELRO|nr:hypothetical protein HELRODRAFT_177812 [Helobdella robusta]ESN97750.1 hypothetical protein HELRODRAFT_177812 [Helobdella robusta]
MANILLILFLNIVSAKTSCFHRYLEEKVDFCSCDHPIEATSLSAFSFMEAVLLCSMRCSQIAGCVVYNFFIATNQCQLFNQTLNKFSVLPGCINYFKNDGENPPIIRPLTITVDNELWEFYLNGNNVSVAKHFPNARFWSIPDTYNLTGGIQVIALKTYNYQGDGGFIASTSDSYILTNATWKCSLNYYDGWYKIYYNDSFWPAAKNAIWPTSTNYYPPLSKAAKWIVDSTDCKNCVLYCRKNVIGKFQNICNNFRYRILFKIRLFFVSEYVEPNGCL